MIGAPDLIEAVNALRASNGLAPYQVNRALMVSAQEHTDYQASIGEITYTGPGGSRPHDRAAAAGYGGGMPFYISENIAGGTNLSAEAAVSMWQSDEPHLSAMLGPNYNDVGAGMTVANNFVYFTLDAAYLSGGSSKPPSLSTSITATALTLVAPVKTATAGPDGSIIHIVEYGQTLTGIAGAYKIDLAELIRLNLLSNTDIFVGEKLIVRAAFTPTPTVQAIATIPTQTPTLLPTHTPRPPTTVPASPRPVATTPPARTPGPTVFSGLSKDPLLLSIIIVAAAGFLMMAAGRLLRKK
jgi:LysM repeat protein